MMKDNEYLESLYNRYEEVKIKKEKNEFYQTKFKKNKMKPFKMVASFVLILGITVGIAYGTGVMNTSEEKIWKEPKAYTINRQEIMSKEIEEKCMSEEEALKKGTQWFQKYGFSQEATTGFLYQLRRNENPVWHLSGGNASISIDAITGEFLSFNEPTIGKDLSKASCTREEAKQVGKELFEKYQSKDGNYEMVKLTRNMDDDEHSYLWYATFCKKYDELYNPYEYIEIGWIPGLNELYSIHIEDKKYENNPIQISKEKAIQIATQKDKTLFNNKTITETKAEIRIEKMNAEVYLREKYKEDYLKKKREEISNTEEVTVYVTDKRVRKVWVVAIEHEKEEEKKETIQAEDTYIVENNTESKYSYYVDATTGEIIGGSSWNYFDSEKFMKEDPTILVKME